MSNLLANKETRFKADLKKSVQEGRIREIEKELNHVDFFQEFNTSKVESIWRRLQRKPYSLPMLHSRFITLRADQPYHEPDPAFVERLKEISERFSVHWLGLNQRWAIFIDVPAIWTFQWQRNTFVVRDQYPMLFKVVQSAKGNFMPLDGRWLRFLNYNTMDVYRFLAKMRDAEDRYALELEKWKKERYAELRDMEQPLVEKKLQKHQHHLQEYLRQTDN